MTQRSITKNLSNTQKPGRPVLVPGTRLTVLTVLPPAPKWLPNEHAVEEWGRLGALMLANGMLTAEGLPTFGQLCAVTGRLIEIWSEGKKIGRTPSTALMGQFRQLTAEFGLTPIAQTRISSITQGPGPAEEGNPFKRNGRPAGDKASRLQLDS